MWPKPIDLASHGIDINRILLYGSKLIYRRIEQFLLLFNMILTTVAAAFTYQYIFSSNEIQNYVIVIYSVVLNLYQNNLQIYFNGNKSQIGKFK
jgi:hypothetical protein